MTQRNQPPTLDAGQETLSDLEPLELAHSRLPPWLLSAKPEIIAALSAAITKSRACHVQVAQTLAELKSVEHYCAPLLSAELKRYFGPVLEIHPALDIHRDYLAVVNVRMVPGDTLLATLRPLREREKPISLLGAALKNFSADQAQVGGFSSLSYIFREGWPEQHRPVLPFQFAALCRSLDLGLKYQRYLQGYFGVTATGEANPNTEQLAVLTNLRLLKIHEMEVDAHIAFLKQDISEAVYTALIGLLQPNADASVRQDGGPFYRSTLSILGTPIEGVVLFSTDMYLGHPGDHQVFFATPGHRLVAYIPNDPIAPFREYDSVDGFAAELRRRLSDPSYQAFFSGFIALDARTAFFQGINSRPETLDLRMSALGMRAELYLSSNQLKRMLADAQVVAVPTAVLDAREREEKWQRYESVGLLLANIAAFVVPGVGELMLAVAVGHLLKEVFEGVEDWSRGDTDHALEHLLNVAKEVATAAVMVAGGAVIKKGFSTLSSASRSFFDGFEPITSADNTPKLWNKNLLAYARQLPAEAPIYADAQGFISVEGKRHVQVKGAYYQVELDPLLKQWRIAHPLRVNAFKPALLHNNEGAWRFAHERPLEWQGSTTLMGRLRGDTVLDESTLEQVRALTDTHADLLRQVHLDNLATPSLLKVSLKRFEIDRQISTFIDAMSGNDYNAGRLADLQLTVLSRLAGWPSDKALGLLSLDGQPLAQYGTTLRDSTSIINLSPSVLAQGKVLETVLKGLSIEQVHTLMGEGVSLSPLPVQALARQLGAYALENRAQLFEHFYERFNVSTAAQAKPIEAAFPGLPRPVAQILAESATHLQSEQLRAAKVPLEVAEHARVYLREGRLNRAFEGFYLESMSNADTEQLALHFLPLLPGWPAEARIEIREDSVLGQVLHRLGDAAAVQPVVLIKTAQGYQRYAAYGAMYRLEPGPPLPLPQAIFQSFTPRQRQALGFPLLADAPAFNAALAKRAVTARSESARLLGMQPIKPGFNPPVRFAEGKLGYPLCGLDAGGYSSSLRRRVRALYPAFNDEQVVEYLDAMVEAGVNPLSVLRERKRERRVLLRSLQSWINSTSIDFPSADEFHSYEDSRHCAAWLIAHAWRQGTRYAPWIKPVEGLRLSLDGLRVGSLLRLPSGVDFSHVQELSLSNMDSRNSVGEFLAHFSGLVSLEMDNSQMLHIPPQLQNMSGLTRLSMARNSVSLLPHNIAVLNALSKLEVLNLNDNPLGHGLDLSNLEHLRRVYLRRTGIDQWPTGLIARPLLEVADLRENRITDIPEQVFSGSALLSRNTTLSGNPLSASTRLRLARHAMQGGSTLGISSDAMMDEAAVFDFWTVGITHNELIRRESLWGNLKSDPGSEDFFSLIGRLSTTADSQIIRQDLARRVWEMIEAANNSSILRRNLLDVAGAPRSCADSVALCFGSLEIQMLLHNMRVSAPAQEAEMLILARGLFRLEQLANIATETAAKQVRAGIASDELEVHLAYRVGLAKALELPGQPTSMMFKKIAGVTQDDLDLAQTQVLLAEKTSLLVDFVSTRDFWQDYLKHKYHEEYQTLTEPYFLQLNGILRRSPGMTSARYMGEVEAIRNDMDVAVHAWYRQKSIAVLPVSLADFSGEKLIRQTGV